MRQNIWCSRKNGNYHSATDDLNLDNGHRSYCQEGIFLQTVDKMRIEIENDNQVFSPDFSIESDNDLPYACLLIRDA